MSLKQHLNVRATSLLAGALATAVIGLTAMVADDDSAPPHRPPSAMR